MNAVIEKVVKCVKDHRGVPRKAAVLPISSLTAMDDFETIDENGYSDVVSKKKKQYFLFTLSFSCLSVRLSISLINTHACACAFSHSFIQLYIYI